MEVALITQTRKLLVLFHAAHYSPAACLLLNIAPEGFPVFLVVAPGVPGRDAQGVAVKVIKLRQTVQFLADQLKAGAPRKKIWSMKDAAAEGGDRAPARQRKSAGRGPEEIICQAEAGHRSPFLKNDRQKRAVFA